MTAMTRVWRPCALVIDAHLVGPEDPTEWTGTDITFEITSKQDGTEVRFSHLGLVPEFECFDACSSARGSLSTEA
jgi:hypothetical protein